MEKITFKGPFPLSELVKSNSNFDKKTGLYIWGFMSNSKNIIESSNFNIFEEQRIFNSNLKPDPINGDVFIPYYMGQTSNLLRRLNNHSTVQSGDATKYTRLNKFPLLNINSNTYFANNRTLITELINDNKIYYFNNEKILKEIYKNHIETEGVNEKKKKPEKLEYPINKQKYKGEFLSKNDPLKKLVDNNNFFFFYHSFSEKMKRTDIEKLEAYVFFRLKTFTLSKANYSMQDLMKFELDNKFDFNSNIFKIFKDEISEIFPGY